MMYLLAILLPPVAVLFSGKPLTALITLLLQITIIGWIPAAIWALAIVASRQADQRTDRVVKAVRSQATRPH